eukprot:Opistho-2@899
MLSSILTYKRLSTTSGNVRLFSHVSVLAKETVAFLVPAVGKGGVIVDATFGNGGHTRALLEKLGPTVRVIAIDRDPVAYERAVQLSKEDGRVIPTPPGRFSNIANICSSIGFGDSSVDAILFDFGVSSMQLDDPLRGFSFKRPGPLDMTMGSQAGTEEGGAADVIRSLSQSQLEDIIRKYGEDKNARSIARAIVAERAAKPITTTEDLARIVRRASVGADSIRIDPATRTFQAFRIFVNDEMREIERALPAASRLLNVGGRLAAISFHGLEDALVKKYIRDNSSSADDKTSANRIPTIKGLTRKPVSPTEEEILANPRSRSARLRIVERIS